MATDLDSVFYCTYAALPHMIERGGGRIVNMASIVGQMGNLGQSNYAAAKAGIVGFSKSAAQELARFNITVNALCPGFIETDMVTNLTDDVKAGAPGQDPAGPLRQAGRGGRASPLPRAPRAATSPARRSTSTAGCTCSRLPTVVSPSTRHKASESQARARPTIPLRRLLLLTVLTAAVAFALQATVVAYERALRGRDRPVRDAAGRGGDGLRVAAAVSRWRPAEAGAMMAVALFLVGLGL